MNWRRGLFRLWVVFAFLWIGVSGWYQYINKPWNQNWGPFQTEDRCWNAIAKWPDGQDMAPWEALGDEMDTPGNIETNMSVVKTFGTICGEIERRIWRIC